jgi:protein dithiol:quinone oxidoreductase
MNMLSRRFVYFLGFIAITLLLSGAFYLEKYDGFNPCPLCVLQRIDVAFLGIVFFMGAVIPFKKIGSVILGFISLFVALIGIFLAGRQVWLQHLPPNSNADCGVSLQYLMHVLPLDEVMKKVLQGTAECSQTGWELMHISLAEWSLACFVGFAVLALWQTWRAGTSK